MSSNPFDQLIRLAGAPGTARKRLPKSGASTVVLQGKRITDLRQIEPEERKVYEELVMRDEWQEANRDELRACKQQLDAERQDQIRQSKKEYAARAYQADPDKMRARCREHYQRNREAILAQKAEQRKAQRLAKAALDKK